jgi:16S rRNA C967 or C1407 C5-methylase (RsmB/RsmF family)
MEIVHDLERLERYRDIVGDWQAFAEASVAPLPTTLWTHAQRMPRAEVAAWLAEEGVATRELPWYALGLATKGEGRPGKTLAYLTGACHIQEAVSMMPILLLDPQPGDRVLDLCAAPGNKTVQAAVHMADQGTVLACDLHGGRIGMIIRTVERLALTCVATLLADAGNLPRALGDFDRVLADVPCGCEGTTRKNTNLLYRSSAGPGLLRPTQEAILRKAIQRTVPGGRIVYSTCTYAPEENELVLDAVLRDLGDQAELIPASLPGIVAAPGLTHWQGRELLPELRHCLRLYPHLNDTGGFFIAVLERRTP